MNLLEQQGLLFVYICGVLYEETNRIEIKQVNSQRYAFQEFEEEILEIRRGALNSFDQEHILELFVVIGRKNRIKEVENIVLKTIRSFREDMKNSDFSIHDKLQKMDTIENEDTLKTLLFLYLKHLICDDSIRYPIRFLEEFDDNLCLCLYSDESPNTDRSALAKSIFNIWYVNEKPISYGKQVVSGSFMLDDLKGRRIIAYLPDYETGETYLLLEGGLKLYLRSEHPYFREKLGYSNMNMMTLGDMDTILSNPVYAFNKFFQPYELYEDWQKVLNYVLAISDIEWCVTDLKKVHKAFMQFMEEEICETGLVKGDETIITEEKYYLAYQRRIGEIRDYFSGKEEAIISKDYIQLLTTRYVFLPAVLHIVKREFPNYSLYKAPGRFEIMEYNKLLKDLDANDNTEKGKALENIAEYLMDASENFQVMGKRIRTSREEIDLCCCNISLNSEVWKWGAFILIECKNWSDKVGIEVIRDLGYIMSYKGNRTSILFAGNGITSRAQDEIINYAMSEKYILCIDKKELEAIRNKEDFEQLLHFKYHALISKIENSIELLGV